MSILDIISLADKDYINLFNGKYQTTTDIIKMFGAGLVFVIGLYQYMIAQIWKKSVFASEQLDLLWKDNNLKFCITALDWSQRKIELCNDKTIDHDITLMWKCMYVETRHVYSHNSNAIISELDGENIDFEKSTYRDAFDKLLYYLERQYNHIICKQYKIKHIKILAYYLEELVESRFFQYTDIDCNLRKKHRRQFMLGYMLSYRYVDALKLIWSMRQYMVNLTDGNKLAILDHINEAHLQGLIKFSFYERIKYSKRPLQIKLIFKEYMYGLGYKEKAKTA